MRICRWADTPCLLTLSAAGASAAGGAAYREWLSQSTQCRLERSAPRSNGDMNAVLDETEAAWAVCADKVDTIIAWSGARQ